ncbi:hypothetical protein [Ornithinimicrobium kibberense]|uniref:hypothetical protein n=1 Tax=Ornithinimicrobium kibberense TaxID=282060 RepID=UPI00361C9A01
MDRHRGHARARRGPRAGQAPDDGDPAGPRRGRHQHRAAGLAVRPHLQPRRDERVDARPRPAADLRRRHPVRRGRLAALDDPPRAGLNRARRPVAPTLGRFLHEPRQLTCGNAHRPCTNRTTVGAAPASTGPVSRGSGADPAPPRRPCRSRARRARGPR